jgi:hypothetical protein
MRTLTAMGASTLWGNPEMLFGKLYLMKPEGERKVVWKGEVTKTVMFKELLRDALTEEIKEASFKPVSKYFNKLQIRMTLCIMYSAHSRGLSTEDNSNLSQ